MKDIPPSLADYCKAIPQYLLPGHPLSRLMLAITRVKSTSFKNRFIDWFLRAYNIDLSEAMEENPHAYPDFNSFFTRALKPGARKVVEAAGTVASPVDGTVSQSGPITAGRIFQAKGRDYSLLELLGGSVEATSRLLGGEFATIYLSPRNYHRIHMPVDGVLTSMVHVPGRLFSVNAATTRVVPRLFARNERVVAHFDTEAGPMAVVMVGALFVSSIETVWSGVVTPPAGRVVRSWNYVSDDAPRFRKGDEIGRFNMGSTVILLFGPDAVQWSGNMAHNTPVTMGQLVANHGVSPATVASSRAGGGIL